MLWHFTHLTAEGTAHPLDLPQREFAFSMDKLKGEPSTVGTRQAVAFFEAADVNCFSTARAG